MNARSPRILAVSDFYLPRAGGVERVVHETARHLVGQGVGVEVLTRRLEGDAAGHEVVDGVGIHRVGNGPRALWLERIQLRRALAGFAKELPRFDLVHAHLSLVAGPLLGAIERAGVPLVASYYGPWHLEYLEEMADAAVPSRWPRPLRPVARPLVAAALFRMQRRVLRAAKLVIVLSEHSRRELHALGFGIRVPVVTIPGGVDVERFRPLPAATAASLVPGLEGVGRPLLVAVRRLVPRMGLMALLDAVYRLRPSYPHLTLAVGGSGPLAEPLVREAQRLGIGDAVRMLGRVSDSDLPRLYAAADLTVVPTRALEGFGLPVLESWACGVPVVATRAGALEELVGTLGSDWSSASAEGPDLAVAIDRALTGLAGRGGGPDREAVAERVRNLALSHRWQLISEQLAQAYQSVYRTKGNL